MLNRNWFSIINSHPILFIGLVGFIYCVWPEFIPKLEVADTKIKVADGFLYNRQSPAEIEVYPYMVQKKFLGMPKKSGVTAAVYYVTKGDLEEAKEQYSQNGGCWPATFSSFKRELLIVGDYSKIKRKISREGPPQLNQEAKFIKIQGSRLTPVIRGQEEEQAQQIAEMRNSGFYYLERVSSTY